MSPPPQFLSLSLSLDIIFASHIISRFLSLLLPFSFHHYVFLCFIPLYIPLNTHTYLHTFFMLSLPSNLSLSFLIAHITLFIPPPCLPRVISTPFSGSFVFDIFSSRSFVLSLSLSFVSSFVYMFPLFATSLSDWPFFLSL